MDNQTKRNIITMLRFGPVVIDFIKEDGTERRMRCSLSAVDIPSEKEPKTFIPDTSETIRVFDVEKQDWRSFRWDSVERAYVDHGKKATVLYFKVGS